MTYKVDKNMFQIIEKNIIEKLNEEILMVSREDFTLDVSVSYINEGGFKDTTSINLTIEQATALKVWLEEQGY